MENTNGTTERAFSGHIVVRLLLLLLLQHETVDTVHEIIEYNIVSCEDKGQYKQTIPDLARMDS